MNLSKNIGSRLIITRATQPDATRSCVGIACARTLSQAAAAPPTQTPSSAPTNSSSSSLPSQPLSTAQTKTTQKTSSAPSTASSESTSRASQLDDGAASSTSASNSTPNDNPSSSASAGGKGENLTSASTWLWRTIYLTAAAGGAGLAVQYAYDPKPIQQVGQTVYDGLNARIRYFTEPSRDKLLPDQPQSGYGANMPPPRTLVIDLENTLVHSTYSRATGWRVAKRPGAEAFLAYLASFYELVVFTSNLYSYADPILNKLDRSGYIQHRLYRPDNHFRNGVHIKDLSWLNRPLERVVVIDKDPKCVSMHPENAIIVPEWTGDPSDTTLLDLIPMLEGIVREDVADVRDVLRQLEGKSVSDAVTEYRASAAARAEQALARPSSVFGHVADNPAPPPAQAPTGEGDADGDASAGGEQSASLWGTLPGRSKLFQSKNG